MKQMDMIKHEANMTSQESFVYDEALERKKTKKAFHGKIYYLPLFLILAFSVGSMLIMTATGRSKYNESGLSIYYLYVGFILAISGSMLSLIFFLTVGHFRVEKNGVYLSFTKANLKEIFIPFTAIDKIIIYYPSSVDGPERPKSIYLLTENNYYTNTTKTIDNLTIIDEIIMQWEICNPKKLITVLEKYFSVETLFQDKIELPHIHRFYKEL